MSERLNTQDLIDLLMKRQGLERKEAELFIKEFFVLIEEGLEKDKIVKIKGLGTFKLIGVESRESVDVNTGERIEIRGHTKISFVPDVALRDIINKPFAHFETVVLNDNMDLDTENTPQEEGEAHTIEVDEEPASNIVVSEEQEPTIVVQEKVSEEVEAVDSNVDDIVESTQEEVGEKKKETGSSNNNILILVVVLVTLLCVALLFFTYFSDIFSNSKKAKLAPIQKTIIIENHPIDSVINKDSVDTGIILEPSKAEKETSTPPITASSNRKKNMIPFSQIPVNPDSTSYEIVGTKLQHTVREGESLIRISYRYYGTKDLYPYLIMYNRSIINDPNLVPYGTKINIPELKKK